MLKWTGKLACAFGSVEKSVLKGNIILVLSEDGRAVIDNKFLLFRKFMKILPLWYFDPIHIIVRPKKINCLFPVTVRKKIG